MTDAADETRSVVKVRDLAYPPEKVWRALTEKHLIAEWLMPSDFRPEVGHRFDLVADWGTIACKVLTIAPPETLAYTWEAQGLASVVTWTLVRTGTGTRLTMEQTGFVAGQDRAYRGAASGWTRFLDRFEQVVAQLDGNTQKDTTS